MIGTRALVNPNVEEVLAAVATQAPHLLPAGRPCPPSALGWPRWWAPLSSVGLAALWAGLAIWHPTTTYHLGPLLAAAAWPRVARWRAGQSLRLRTAVVVTGAGALVALATLALLLWRHALRGPDPGRPRRPGHRIAAASSAWQRLRAVGGEPGNPP